MARKRYKPSVVFSCSALVVNQICGVPLTPAFSIAEWTEEGAGERSPDRGLSVPQGTGGDVGGTPLDIIRVVAVRSNQCPIKQRGAGRPDPPRPLLPFPSVPTHGRRYRKI
jgi:hypothetical protein